MDTTDHWMYCCLRSNLYDALTKCSQIITDPPPNNLLLTFSRLKVSSSLKQQTIYYSENKQPRSSKRFRYGLINYSNNMSYTGSIYCFSEAF